MKLLIPVLLLLSVIVRGQKPHSGPVVVNDDRQGDYEMRWNDTTYFSIKVKWDCDKVYKLMKVHTRQKDTFRGGKFYNADNQGWDEYFIILNKTDRLIIQREDIVSIL